MQTNPLYENFKTAALKVYSTSESVVALSSDAIRSLAGTETSDSTELFFGNMQKTLLTELRQQENELLCKSVTTYLAERFPAVGATMRSRGVMEIYLEGRNADEDMTPTEEDMASSIEEAL